MERLTTGFDLLDWHQVAKPHGFTGRDCESGSAPVFSGLSFKKLLFRLPRWLSFACIAVDIAGFGYLAIVLKQQSVCCDFSPPIPVAGLGWGCFAFCAIALLWCLLWTLNYIIRKRLWTSNAEAFKTFQVNYEALYEPRTFDFSEDLRHGTKQRTQT